MKKKFMKIIAMALTLATLFTFAAPALADRGEIVDGWGEEEVIDEMPITSTVENLKDLPVLEGEFRSEPTLNEILEIEENREEIFESAPERLPYEITPEGYQRIYLSPEFTTTSQNSKYELLGSVSVYNSTSSKGRLDYSQGTTKTVQWNVGGSVSVNAEIEAKFLAKLGGSFNVTVARSTTTSKSSTVTYSTEVPARTSRTITCYQTAIYGSGKITYWDYTPTGTAVRSGTLNVSGYAPVVNGYQYYAS